MEQQFWTDCPVVEVVPGWLNGRPVIRHSRVLADTIMECAELGETPEETAMNYGLDLKDVLATRAYYQARQNSALASWSEFSSIRTYPGPSGVS